MFDKCKKYRLTNIDMTQLECRYREDWGLEDPSGKEDEAFVETARMIETKVLDLAERIKQKAI